MILKFPEYISEQLGRLERMIERDNRGLDGLSLDPKNLATAVYSPLIQGCGALERCWIHDIIFVSKPSAGMSRLVEESGISSGYKGKITVEGNNHGWLHAMCGLVALDKEEAPLLERLCADLAFKTILYPTLYSDKGILTRQVSQEVRKQGLTERAFWFTVGGDIIQHYPNPVPEDEMAFDVYGLHVLQEYLRLRELGVKPKLTQLIAGVEQALCSLNIQEHHQSPFFEIGEKYVKPGWVHRLYYLGGIIPGPLFKNHITNSG